MTTADTPKQPATPYDAEITVLEGNRLVGEISIAYINGLKLQRRGYRNALADLAPLHRQLVAALETVLAIVSEPSGNFKAQAAERPTDFPYAAVWNKATAALDAARKAGL